jgi:hypothetical protein
MTPYIDTIPETLRALADEIQKQRGPSILELLFLCPYSNDGNAEFNISFSADYEDYGSENEEVKLIDLIRECVDHGAGEFSARDKYVSAIIKLRDELNSLIISIEHRRPSPR